MEHNTESLWPITALANSVARFSAAVTVFGMEQIRSAIVHPVSALRVTKPVSEALDSASEVLSPNLLETAAPQETPEDMGQSETVETSPSAQTKRVRKGKKNS